MTKFLVANDLHLVYDICMRNLLKEKGYKATPARIAILEVFVSKKPYIFTNDGMWYAQNTHGKVML